MADIESDKVFVKLNTFEATEYKKRVLEMVEGLIHAEISSKKFCDLRIKEKKIVSRLKNDLKDIHRDVQKLHAKLPHKIHHKEEHTPLKETKEHPKEKSVKKSKKLSKAVRYKVELEEIKAKLSKLG